MTAVPGEGFVVAVFDEGSPGIPEQLFKDVFFCQAISTPDLNRFVRIPESQFGTLGFGPERVFHMGR